MKHFYQKTLLFLLMCMAGVKVMAYDCEVNGIYYYLVGTEAYVTYKGTQGYTILNDYAGSIVIPKTITRLSASTVCCAKRICRSTTKHCSVRCC